MVNQVNSPMEPAYPNPSDNENSLWIKLVVNLRLLCAQRGVECGDVCACQGNDVDLQRKAVLLSARLVKGA